MPDFAAIADGMTTPTSAQMVVLLTNAIAAVTLGGQVVTVNGRTITRADLADLENELVIWKQRAALDEGQSPVTFSKFNRM